MDQVFRRILGKTERSLVNEIIAVRKRWAHQEPFSSDDAYRALDSVERLLAAVSAPESDEVGRMKMELLRRRFDEQARGEKRKSVSQAIESEETNSPAERAAKAILEQRGNRPRLYRNTLVFLATDKTRLRDLDEAARKFLAWVSILAEQNTDCPVPMPPPEPERHASSAANRPHRLEIHCFYSFQPPEPLVSLVPGPPTHRARRHGAGPGRHRALCHPHRRFRPLPFGVRTGTRPRPHRIDRPLCPGQVLATRLSADHVR